MTLAKWVVLAAALLAVLAQGCGDFYSDEDEEIPAAPPRKPEWNLAEFYAELHFDDIDRAYDHASPDDFTSIDDAKNLPGEAVTDFATMTRNCTSEKQYKVRARRWSAHHLPASGTDRTIVQRELFTLDVHSAHSAFSSVGRDGGPQNEVPPKTIVLAVYDEMGVLITSRESFAGLELVRINGAAAYRALIARCDQPRL